MLLRNQQYLCDLMKQAVFRYDWELFDRLDFHDDAVFTEPALVHFFFGSGFWLRKKAGDTLRQQVVGYLKPEERPVILRVKADGDGLVNLPGLGYLRMVPGQGKKIRSLSLEEGMLRNFYLPETRIRLCIHRCGELTGLALPESPEQTLTRHIGPLTDAVNFFRLAERDGWQAVEPILREVVVFRSRPGISLTSLTYHGTLFLNLGRASVTIVSMLDLIARECGCMLYDLGVLDLMVENQAGRFLGRRLSPLISLNRLCRQLFSLGMSLSSLRTLSEWSCLLGSRQAEVIRREAAERIRGHQQHYRALREKADSIRRNAAYCDGTELTAGNLIWELDRRFFPAAGEVMNRRSINPYP